MKSAVAKSIRIKILSNHGAEHTCLYLVSTYLPYCTLLLSTNHSLFTFRCELLVKQSKDASVYIQSINPSHTQSYCSQELFNSHQVIRVDHYLDVFNPIYFVIFCPYLESHQPHNFLSFFSLPSLVLSKALLKYNL